MGSTVLRIVGWAVALLVGAFYGAAGTVGQAFMLGPVPVGLVLATIGSAALLIALRTLTGDRVNALFGGLGITAATFLFSQVGPGGSAIVAAPTPGHRMGSAAVDDRRPRADGAGGVLARPVAPAGAGGIRPVLTARRWLSLSKRPGVRGVPVPSTGSGIWACVGPSGRGGG
ncbi:hypothetical protein QE430_002631 [Microbacterium testaceum]|uniref:hypothetical protein n=1 Tax=Microbacterium testaceum TaxID=2033 RepID=UPI00278A38C4|nr:hypothetical protein [Microbacterium testaceum]MDQ1174324.1 hypothetical protein [Microbacterium testaceum]